MSIGIIAAIFISWHHDEDSFGLRIPWEGILGGSVNCIALSLFPHTMKYAGLGIGFVVWIGVSTVVGWAIGRYGFFGLTQPEPARYPMIDYLGVSLCIMALVAILFVKPTLDASNKKKTVLNRIGRIFNKEHANISLARVLLSESDSDNAQQTKKIRSYTSITKHNSKSLYAYLTASNASLSRQRSLSTTAIDTTATPTAIPTTCYCGSYFDFKRFAKETLKYQANAATASTPYSAVSVEVHETMSPIMMPTPVLKECTINHDPEDGVPALVSSVGSVLSLSNDPLSDDDHETWAHSRKTVNIKSKKRRRMKKHQSLSWRKRLFGVLLAVIQGLIGGNANTTPFLMYKKRINTNDDVLDYVLSYCLGLYLASSVLFMVMGVWKKVKKRKWLKPVVRPAFISGFIWGIGFVAYIYSTL
eukprot:9105_1